MQAVSFSGGSTVADEGGLVHHADDAPFVVVANENEDIAVVVVSAVNEAARVSASTVFKRTVLIPRRSEWAYSFDAPADDWAEPAFDDSAWKRGLGVFGHGLAGVRCGVDWSGTDIWARRHFTLDDPASVSCAEILLYHDDDADVYLNGVKLLSVGGCTSAYEAIVLDKAKFLEAARKGDNVLSVHVHQRFGGQAFDAAFMYY